jgi:hypothetical protein
VYRAGRQIKINVTLHSAGLVLKKYWFYAGLHRRKKEILKELKNFSLIMYKVEKIISGGQTGADRAALDFAIENKIPYGGWLPKGRKTEDGTLPLKYHLQEMPTGDYSKRTEKNVLDSDGTGIVSHGFLKMGSALTREFAVQHNKPWIHLDMKELSLQEAAERMISWLTENQIKILNVAGPRAGNDPTIYDTTLRLLEIAFLKI